MFAAQPISRPIIWVLEDDDDCFFIFDEILSTRFCVERFITLRDLRAGIHKPQRPVALIADMRLPDGLFVDMLLKNEVTPSTVGPIVVVSSNDDLDLLRETYRLGAAHFLVKPFSNNELIAKLEHLLRAEPPGDRADIGIDTRSMTVRVRDKVSEPLTAKELQIVTVIVQSRRDGLPRAELVDAVWSGTAVSAKALDVHLVNLRRKLRAVGLAVDFETGKGFFLSRVNLS